MREKERKREKNKKKREKERKRENKIEREKRCPGSIIINLHSILKRKTKYIGRNSRNLKKWQLPPRIYLYTIIDQRHYQESRPKTRRDDGENPLNSSTKPFGGQVYSPMCVRIYRCGR